MRIDLPDNGWAQLRAPDAIPRRQARAYREVMYAVAGGAASGADISPGMSREEAEARAARVVMTAQGMASIEDLADALVLAVVAEWSYGAVDADTLGTLPDAAVNAIYNAAQADGYLDKLNPDFGPSPDPDSPTLPSAP